MVVAAEGLRSEAGDAAAVMQEALSHVLPCLPGMIEERLPKADAQIYTKAQVQALLAQFAADVLAVQGECLVQSVRQRSRL